MTNAPERFKDDNPYTRYTYDPQLHSLDVTEPLHEVEIQIRHDGRTIWINVDGICALRVSRIPEHALVVNDPRRGSEKPAGRSKVPAA